MELLEVVEAPFEYERVSGILRYECIEERVQRRDAYAAMAPK